MTRGPRPAGWGPRDLNEAYTVDLIAHVQAGWLTSEQAEAEARNASHVGEAEAYGGRRFAIVANVADGTVTTNGCGLETSYLFTDDERAAAALISQGWLEWSTTKRRAYADGLTRDAQHNVADAEIDEALAIASIHAVAGHSVQR